jgi:acetyltransferase-like isoleucine patch superfamily enzyme
LYFRWTIRGCSIGKRVYIGKHVDIEVTNGRLQIKSDAVINHFCSIKVRKGSLVIGTDCFIGRGTLICAVEKVEIGDHCLIAEFVTIRDQNHGVDVNGIPFGQQPVVSSPINIKENVWIGAKASVLAGVQIGRDSVVAAHAVVNKNVDAATVVGGVPAKIIKKLGSSNPPNIEE